MARLILLILLGAGLLAPGAAAAADRERTRAGLARQMASAGAGSSALVVDLDSGEELYARRPDVRRTPASVEKLYTTSAALLRLGGAERLSTQVLAAAPVGPDGTLAGDLYLKGAGDPALGAAGLTALARTLVGQAGLRALSGRVRGDETAFDRRRGPPSSGFTTSVYVGPLSALSYNRGQTGVRSPFFQVSPGLFAAQAFERALRREGVEVGARARTGRAPAGVLPLAAAASPTVAELVARTNRPSDNFYAETLIKLLGARFGAGGTTVAGARVVRSEMTQLGIAPHVVDGSGLSRANATSPREVVGLLRAMAADPLNGPSLLDSLPVAGRSGTLTGRMRGTAAAGNCRAKTGTLTSVSGLAGYCTGADGTRFAFALLMNRVSTFGARRLQDRMAVALARYAD